MKRNEIQHYGVPGMKWGVRKDRRVYSKTKRLYDKQVRKKTEKEQASEKYLEAQKNRTNVFGMNKTRKLERLWNQKLKASKQYEESLRKGKEYYNKIKDKPLRLSDEEKRYIAKIGKEYSLDDAVREFLPHAQEHQRKKYLG